MDDLLEHLALELQIDAAHFACAPAEAVEASLKLRATAEVAAV